MRSNISRFAWHCLLAITSSTAAATSSRRVNFLHRECHALFASSSSSSSARVLPRPRVISSSSSTPSPSSSSSSSSRRGGVPLRISECDIIDDSDVTMTESPSITIPPVSVEDPSPSSSPSLVRRSLLHGARALLLLSPSYSYYRPPAAYADFAPGGTLLDREISVTYGNVEASPSRSRDNSNVLFDRDNYYKFGSAAPWIPPDSTDFPKTMPFVPNQQRYDAYKKYGSRIVDMRDAMIRIGKSSTSIDDVPDKDDPIYHLRALGLFANAMIATENTGTTNELMLARWYINEMYLRIGDYRDALSNGDVAGARERYEILVRATNSYLSLMNRSISAKVGDRFDYI